MDGALDPVKPEPRPLTDAQIDASVQLYTMQWNLAQPRKGRRQSRADWQRAADAYHALQILATVAALKAAAAKGPA